MTRHLTKVAATLLLISTTLDPLFGQSSEGLRVQLDEIAKAQVEARDRFTKDLEGKVTEQEQQPPIDRFHAAVAKHTNLILDLIQANPTDPAVVDACNFVIKTARAGPGEQSYRALEVLLRDHSRDPGMGELCRGIFFYVHSPVAEALLRSVMANHPNRVDRGWACHTLATFLKLQAKMVRRVRKVPAEVNRYVHEHHKEATERLIREADPTALEREAEALLERIIAEYADIKGRDETRNLGMIAAGELFAMRNLSIGKVAPEIQGKDHEGKTFSLSDYRGKVTVLTFSGNWCGPCVGMYPQERELIARSEGKPFVLLSVNSDSEVETLKSSIDSGKVTWRCWWDGGMEGPITSRWGISSFPSIFVLDKAGIIRFRDVRGDELDQAVALLLAEASAEKDFSN
ncbi:TlpA disulfide reductase family protein [Singulisphaera sp. Ch08]|uniref:TlpA disulfide reductase family protein n=1 Tax=Singulisphaera sp. Ch08 TaxID=3120278 RepID=A0AAU7CAA6_9BACT